MMSCKRFALYNYIIALDIILTLLYTSNMLVQTVRLNMIDVGRSKSLATTCSLYIATQLSRFLKAMLSFENIFSVKHFFYYFAQLASTACVNSLRHDFVSVCCRKERHNVPNTVADVWFWVTATNRSVEWKHGFHCFTGPPPACRRAPYMWIQAVDYQILCLDKKKYKCSSWKLTYFLRQTLRSFWVAAVDLEQGF